jgi:putative hydrolases of HD superfamily
MQTEKAPLTLPAINLQDSAWLTAWFEVLHLKQVFRKGWLERGLPPARCESVAEHSFGNAMLCLLLAQQQPNLNVEKILRMALVHDLGEVYVGDLTPTDAVAPAEKYALEKQAVLKILSDLPAGETLLANWEEYEAQVTPEAQFVKQVDRLEFALQAAQYQQADLITADDLLGKVGHQLAEAKVLAPFKDLFTAADKP